MTLEAAAPPEHDFQRARELMVNPARFQKRTSLFVISLVLFVALGLAGGGTSIAELGMLIGVLLVHELGHATAMLVLGYRDVRIFFIPLLGAAASGRPQNVARWKQAVVLLAGPLPGIIAGYVLALLALPYPADTLAVLLIFVNVLNLLPIVPLDGGQLFQVLVFSRHRVLEIVFAWVTAGLTVALSLYFRWWIMALVGVTVLLGLGHRKRVLTAAHDLRDANLPADARQLDDTQAKQLHDAAWSTIPAQFRGGWVGKAQQQADLMQQIFERATQRPPKVGPTVALFGVWLAGWIVAFVAVVALAPRLAAARRPAAQAAIDDRASDDGAGALDTVSTVTGVEANTTAVEALRACRAAGGTAMSTSRTTRAGAIVTTVCDGPARRVFGGTYTRQEIWYCGARPCVIEMTSQVGTDYVTIGNGFEKTLGHPLMVNLDRRCAPHDPPVCPRRARTTQSWQELDGDLVVLLARTLNEQPDDAPVYVTFADRRGQALLQQ